MGKRKRRINGDTDPLASWREQMEHGHVPGYWASVGRLPPAASVRAAFGCSTLLLGSMLLLVGIVGILAGIPESLIGALGNMALGGALVWVGNRTLRHRRRKRRSNAAR